MLVSSGVMFGGCNKMLDLDPLDQIADGNYWKKENDFKLFANSFYGWRRDFSAVISSNPHSDYRSDLVTFPTPDAYSNGSNTIPATDGNFSGAFSRIRLANTLLENAQKFANKSEIAQYVAEARFFRAYVYFDLLQLFGDAPIIEGVVDVTDPVLVSKRNDRSEVADFIIADLKAAIPALPLESAIAAADKGRVSQGTAQAFLSRVALFEGTWQKFRDNASRGTELLNIAASAARDVMNSRQYELFKPAALGDSALKYLFILEDAKSNPASIAKNGNKEYIFSNKHDQILNPIGTNITHGLFSNVALITRKLANMYLSQNGLPVDNVNNTQFQGYNTMTSEFDNRDNRMRYTLILPKKAYWTNDNPRVTWTGDATDLATAVTTFYIPGTSGTGYGNQKWCSERDVRDANEGYDFPIIRYAEVLLNYAEAVYERDNAISDADLDLSFNLVRNRVNPDMPKLSNAFVTTNGLNMRAEIRRERTIELFFEGFRIDDLKRWKTAETEMPQNLLGIKYTGTEYATSTLGGWNTANKPKNADGVIIFESGRVWSAKNYLYPIPADQLKLNPNLGQNPGW
ncbi:MAG TPA: RagB/SusD family nutrient uptake outer membrane protein [Niabella sp.]|mgnify:CR=1 FL=1|nr:RagB/SusD family nutrient uptake outer membrane protein [Niabella sp.]